MDKHSLFIFIVGFSCAYAEIKIKKLDMPSSIELGKINETILDCDYEANEEQELEIKWYFNGQQTNLIYQWIPDSHRVGSAVGTFKNHIDLEYNGSNDTYPVYRALKITNIMQNLTGNYTCKVSSYENEDSDTKQLIVYTPPPSGLDLILLQEENIVICSANGVFPKPKLDIYIHGWNDTVDTHDDFEVDENSFNVTSTYFFEESTTNYTNPTKFICELSIPGTDYTESKVVEYYREVDINYIVEEDYLNLSDTFNSTEENFNKTKENSVMAVSASVYLSTLLLVLLLIISK